MGQLLPRMLLPFVALLFTAPQQRKALVVLLLVAALAAVVSVIAIVRYLRFSYRYDERDLVIRSGVLVRNERSIPYVRIQNLDASQNVVQRMLGVTEVFVQTGGGVEPEATLRVLPLAALDEMRTRVLEAGGARAAVPDAERTTPIVASDADQPARGADSEAQPPGPGAAGPRDANARQILLALTPRDLILAGFIENRGMVLILGALALLEQAGATERVVERLIDTEDAAMRTVAERWLGDGGVPMMQGVLYVAAALLVALLFIRLLSTVWALVRLHGFRLERMGDDLNTAYGLLTRVTATIPLRRVQTIIVRDRMLHRLLRRRQVTVETAGGVAGMNGAPQREPIAPILPDDQVPSLLRVLQPGLDLDAIEWQRVHPRAFGRMVRGSLFWPVALSVIAFLIVQEWAVAVFLMLLVNALVRARLRVRNLAWSLTRDSVIVRDGSFTRTIRIARYDRVQVAALRRSPLDMRVGMAHVRADTAGANAGVVIPFLQEDRAAAVQEELVVRTSETAFTW